LIYFRLLFNEFLFLRGFSFGLPFIRLELSSSYFSFLDLKFFSLSDSMMFCIFSDDYIRVYKLKLKLLVKNYDVGLTSFSLLGRINKLIFYWSVCYNYINCFFDVWSSLDLFIYRLLWNSVRKRHPRRPNTWIYAKYWRFFSGFYRFYFLDAYTGGLLLLRSHFYLSVIIARLPLSINYYNFYDEKKIRFFSFNRFRHSFVGLFRYLWIRQKGICFICKRILEFFNGIKIINFDSKKNHFSFYYLIHNYCVL
jgi:hypothetical protein